MNMQFRYCVTKNKHLLSAYFSILKVQFNFTNVRLVTISTAQEQLVVSFAAVTYSNA